MDAALIASECIDTRIRGDVTGVYVQVDTDKIYGHGNWNS